MTSEKKTKAIEIHEDILTYLTKEWEILKEEDAEDDPYQPNICKGNSKTWDFLIISLYKYTFWVGDTVQ